ncbi:hypothetical protein M433DRAFT_771 [Acidomyces richmondensis BFW]|nr:MAG: hypothetical protein FE78DRAFT_32295 [Acidomyces sp. 'richmondensis']KYG49813.1 hypothetical protein M433DRAFT_771 [Acidomyces richmondensis BFW]
MGLHHQNLHGHVLRNEEAVEAPEVRERDGHGDHARMHAPDLVKKNADGGVQTVVSIVYETVSGDFTGPTAGYVTETASATSAATSATYNADESSYHAAKSSAQNRGSSSSARLTSTVATSSVTVSPTSSSNDGSNNKSIFLNPPSTATAASTSSATLGAAAVVGTGVTTSRSASAVAGTPLSTTRGAISQDSYGMSGGAKAGLAFGIIIALGLAAGLVFFCWRRKKNQNSHEELTDEKRVSSGSSFGGNAVSEKRNSTASDRGAPSVRSSRTASTAPRLSLRPVTQFLPSLSENGKSSGNTLDVATAMSEKPKSMWERRSNTSENPFADAAVLSEKQARPESPPNNPFEEPEGKVTAGSHSQKPSWEGSEPSTPKSLKFGTASAVPITTSTANAVPTLPKGPNNVHRVQLDFKPSMDDELELKSGQLVRILHEYDDGWALCIRMDRSQQGVAPRTCLSKLPVKPRPQGPPPMGPNGRPMTPTGPPGMMPRPLTPSNGRDRSGSFAEQQQRPQTPTGGAVPARKPVPGQAL